MALVAIAAFASFYVVKANPSFFIRSQLSTATTTQTYFIRGGLATTTLTLDTGVGAAQGADNADLLLQYISTTSQPTLNVDIQYSQDGVDWYETSMGWNAFYYATSTPALGNVNTLQFLYASSTASRGVSAGTASTAATSTRTIMIPTPTRYVRAVFYESAGGGAASFWAEFIAKRQGN